MQHTLSGNNNDEILKTSDSLTLADSDVNSDNLCSYGATRLVS